MNFEQYLNELKSAYKEEVITIPSQSKETELAKVPEALWECYQLIDRATLPFGRIYSIEQAVKESEHLPFLGLSSGGEWFVFGQDNFFSFWLCKYQKDQSGYSFTAWDHESGTGIGEAADEDIVTFLKEEQEDFEEAKRSYEIWLEENEDEEEDADEY